MKSMVTSIAATGLFAALAFAQGVAQPRHYTVTDLGTLPGDSNTGEENYSSWISNNGLIVGQITIPASTVVGFTGIGVLWRNGTMQDLGVPGFGGPNTWPFVVNDKGQISGYAEASTPDPNGEDFCGNGTNLVCLPVLWQDGVMAALPTLGGPNGVAIGINSAGEIAGSAENTTPDPACPSPQVLQTKPVIWTKGGIQELQTYPGDPEGVAFGINDHGQAVGGSGTCGPFTSALAYVATAHALSWLNGAMIDLGSLGGTGANQGINGIALNNKGEIVGWSDTPGDVETHPFLWTKEKGMQDLGLLPGDTVGFGRDINDAGEICGISMKTPALADGHAVVWVNGKPVDINTLIVAGGNAGLYLGLVDAVNSSGAMPGWGATADGDLHAVLVTPVEGIDAANFVPAEPVVLTEEGRRRLNRPMRVGRFGARLMGPP